MTTRKLNKKDYAVGQQVALRYYGNAARYKEPNAYTLGTITKIGTKIIYVDKGSYEDVKINMEDGLEKTNYTPNYIFYDSEQHLLDAIEAEKLIHKLRNRIGQYGYPDISLEKMKKIMDILED